MADLELLTELVHAVTNGIKTANPSALSTLYSANDKTFSDREPIEVKLTFGLGEIINLVDIHNTKLVSRANVYSLFAALVAVRFPASRLRADLEAPERDSAFTDRANILTNLTTLADAIENDHAEPPLNEFVTAARQGTNTEKNRKIRFMWFHQALTADRL